MGFPLLNVIWMGPLNSMGPGVIVPPCPLLVGLHKTQQTLFSADNKI